MKQNILPMLQDSRNPPVQTLLLVRSSGLPAAAVCGSCLQKKGNPPHFHSAREYGKDWHIQTSGFLQWQSFSGEGWEA